MDNILGVGIDLVEVDRIKKIFNKKEKLSRIFSIKEINYCEKFKDNKWIHYAARFAVKEAVVKAFGKFRYDLKQIEVINIETGKPVMNLKENILISLTHTEKYACACAIWAGTSDKDFK